LAFALEAADQAVAARTANGLAIFGDSLGAIPVARFPWRFPAATDWQVTCLTFFTAGGGYKRIASV
jgi:hypothetical protein